MSYYIVFQSIFKVLLGTMATQIVGGLWYSDKMFAQSWKNSLQIKDEQIKQIVEQRGMAFILLTELLCRLTRTVVFLLLAKNFGFDNQFSDSFQLACWIFIGFILPQLASKTIWEHKSLDYFIICIGEQFLTMMILSIIAVIV